MLEFLFVTLSHGEDFSAQTARHVVPDLPHHSRNAGTAANASFSTTAITRFYRDLLPKVGRRRLGLLPDAQPHAAHPDADDGGRLGTGLGQRPPALQQLRECEAARDRASVPIALRSVAMEEACYVA